MSAFEFVTADSFEAAVTFLAAQKPGEVLVKAGGIDVVDRLKERLETPRTVVNLRKLHDAKDAVRVDQSGGFVAIHALTTLAEMVENATIREKFPALAAAAEMAATPQVRNMATIAGNLCQKPRCWYYRSIDFNCLKKGGSTCYAVEGDNRFHAVIGASACHIVSPSSTAVPLMAYDARLKLVKHADGKMVERVVPLDDFYRTGGNPQEDENVLTFGELIREVQIPLAAGGPRSGYVELKEKQSFDWALAACAANFNDAAKPRVVLGAVAPIPWRLKNAEKALAGGKPTAESIAKAVASALTDAKPMSQNGYKIKLAGVALSRALRQAAQLS